MAMPDITANKNYADNTILLEQDLDDLFIDQIETLYINQTTVTLADNTASPTSIFAVSASSNTAIRVHYSITRSAANIESGSMYIVNDGTNASVTTSGAVIGTMGITFTADIDSGNVRLLYTSTSTGQAATFKYQKIAWQA